MITLPERKQKTPGRIVGLHFGNERLPVTNESQLMRRMKIAFECYEFLFSADHHLIYDERAETIFTTCGNYWTIVLTRRTPAELIVRIPEFDELMTDFVSISYNGVKWKQS